MSKPPYFETLKSLFSSYPVVRYESGEQFPVSQNNETVFFLLSGKVEMSGVAEDGTQVVLTVFHPGSIFPLMLSLSNTPNTYEFKVLQTVQSYAIPAPDAQQILRSNPDILFDTLTRFSFALCGLMRRVQSLSTDTVANRIQSLLLYFYTKYGEKKDTPVPFRLRHEDIASWVGATRETVSREISRLQKEQIISDTQQHITVLDPQRLQNH